MFICPKCGKEYKLKRDLQKHTRSTHPEDCNFVCDVCQSKFQSRMGLARHRKLVHSNINYSCRTCNQQFPTLRALQCHNRQEHRAEGEENPLLSNPPTVPPFRLEEAAFANFVLRYTYERVQRNADVFSYFSSIKVDLLRLLDAISREIHQFKFFMCLHLTLEKEEGETETKQLKVYFCSDPNTVMTNSDFNPTITKAVAEMNAKLENFQKHGSGWEVKNIDKCEVNFAKYKPLRGGCKCKLDRHLLNKQAVLNIECNDYKCFVYSVLASIHPVGGKHNPNRLSNYLPYANELDLKGMHFPTPLTDIDRFEKQNRISVNVYGYEDKTVFPMKMSTSKYKRSVLLLLLNNQHYCLIRDFSRLTFTSTTRNVCPYCIVPKHTREALDEHIRDCRLNAPQRVKMPNEKNDKMRFSRFDKQLPVPFVVYADFECLLQRIDNCSPNPDHSYSQTLQKHDPCAFAYVVVDNNRKVVVSHELYRGEDCVEKFFDCMLKEYEEIRVKLKQKAPMIYGDNEKLKFQNSDTCHIL